MQIISAPRLTVQAPSPLDAAISAVKVAESAAIAGSNSAATVTPETLGAGANAARDAVQLLIAAQPSSPYQHLDWAAKNMQAASDALRSATIVSYGAVIDPSKQAQAVVDVERLAKVAYDAIDSAWESIYND